MAFSGQGQDSLKEGAPGCAHLWVANTDGSDARIVTRGSQSDQERLTHWMLFHWTRDDRYLMGWRIRWDAAGEREQYRALTLVDPDTREMVPVFEYEVGDRERFYGAWLGWADSWDGRHIALTGGTSGASAASGKEEPGGDERSFLRVFSVADRTMTDVLSCHLSHALVVLSPRAAGPSWRSDGRGLVVTQFRVERPGTTGDAPYGPDLYLVRAP